MGETHPHNHHIELSLKASVYPLDVVFAAAYVLLDRAYILVDGDPKDILIVRLKPKGEAALEEIEQDFMDELVNASVYKKQSERFAALREEMLKRALLTNLSSDEDDYKKDEEGILIPWEEKYGDKG
jgi:His-Xaa-Ser system protein HxsD